MRTMTLKYDKPTGMTAYFKDRGNRRVICATALNRQVDLEGANTIRAVVTEHEPRHDEWAEITQEGKIKGVRAQLTPELQSWLYRAYNYGGCRYGYIEIVDE